MSAQVSLSLQIEDVESTSLEKYEFELTITFVWSSCKLRLRSTLEILLNYKIKKVSTKCVKKLNFLLNLEDDENIF